MGSGTPGGALSAIGRAIDTLKPGAVVMVGIAFGVNPRQQRIGDVLVARQLSLYDLQRVGTGAEGQFEIVLRGDRPSAPGSLLEQFRHGALGWPPTPQDAGGQPPRVHFGLVLSGDKLIDHQDFSGQLLRFEREAIGGEMEGAGLYIAASERRVDWMLVKAICDWADGKKGRNKDQHQEHAARNAAQFTLHTIQQGGFVRPAQPVIPAPVVPLPAAPQAPRPQGSAPPSPKLLIGREDDLRELKQRLDTGAAANVQVLTAMRGWPGVGKTTLASALAHDPDLRAQFPDGVLWAALGPNPSVYAELVAWCQALGLPQLGPARSVEELSAQLAAVLRDKRALLIVDDVWDVRDVEPFRVGGRGCAMLITTRLSEIARDIAPTAEQVYVLGVLKPEQALDLLRQLAPTVVAEHPQTCRELVADLEGLPLAIQVAGRLLHAERSSGFSVVALLRDIREGARLIEEKAPADRSEVARDTWPTVGALLEKSTDLLDDHLFGCFATLGVFAPKPATFDAPALEHMWEVDDPRGEIRALVDYGLLEPLDDGRYWLHALLVAHARSLLSEDAEVSTYEPE
jgi:nucleoside phosphorylase